MLQRRRKREKFLPWIYLALDLAVIYGVLIFAFWFRFKSSYFANVVSHEDYEVYYRSFHLTAFTIVFFFRSKNLYTTSLDELTFYQETVRVVKAVTLTTLILLAGSFFVRSFSFSRSFLVIVGPILVLALVLARWVLGSLVLWLDRKRGSLRGVLLVGSDPHLKKIAEHYRKNQRAGRRIYGWLSEKLPKGHLIDGAPVLGARADLSTVLKENRSIHEVVLSEAGVSNEEVLKTIYECEKEMVVFRWIADIFGLIAARMSVSYAGNISLLSFTDSPLVEWENRVLKRLFDIVLSFFALLVLSPVFILIAFLVKKSSPGPVFYRQERIGEDGRHFMLLKFRTMRIDAEKETGPVWASQNDPRRTAIGTFLRENNLDELPQFWNVLVGDMSLVGPRPERPFFVSQFKEDIPRYMARHSIRSGITGWAQVHGFRGNTSIEERTKYDLYYIENWSIILDIKIIFMTVFARKNAY